MIGTSEIKEHKVKRSLNANSYCWVLLQKLADKLNTTKEELYRKYIKEKGIFRTITIDNQAVSTFIHLWQEKGIGWICEVLNEEPSIANPENGLKEVKDGSIDFDNVSFKYMNDCSHVPEELMPKRSRMAEVSKIDNNVC